VGFSHGTIRFADRTTPTVQLDECLEDHVHALRWFKSTSHSYDNRTGWETCYRRGGFV